MQLRKIRKNEIPKICKTFAEIFKDYDSYDVLLKRNCFQKYRIYLLFRYEVFASQNYTYVYDDFSGIASIKKPNDRDVDVKEMWDNPLFVWWFFFWTGKTSRNKALEYMNFAEDIAKKYFNPKTDCYIKNIGIDVKFRGQGKLREMIDKLCEDMPIFLETHDANNVKIYQKLGFELCEAKEWNGVTHYAMRRPEKI